MFRYLNLFLVAAMLTFPAGDAAADDAAPAAGISFFNTETGSCSFSATALEMSHTLRIDVLAKDTGGVCALSERETVGAFSAMLKSHAASDNGAGFGSVMIGPLSRYAWMQKFLTETARHDPDWSAASGRPVAEKTMSYVGGVLSYPAVISVLNSAAQQHGFRFTSTSCEQIQISGDGLPTDAVCWVDMVGR